MQDLLSGPPQVVVVTDRGPANDCNGIEQGYWEENLPRHDRILNKEMVENNVQQNRSEEIAQLELRLRKAEIDAAEAKRVAQQKETLIADLKAQLDQSTAACKDLLETVKEQEDTIEKMS